MSHRASVCSKTQAHHCPAGLNRLAIACTLHIPKNQTEITCISANLAEPASGCTAALLVHVRNCISSLTASHLALPTTSSTACWRTLRPPDKSSTYVVVVVKYTYSCKPAHRCLRAMQHCVQVLGLPCMLCQVQQVTAMLPRGEGEVVSCSTLQLSRSHKCPSPLVYIEADATPLASMQCGNVIACAIACAIAAQQYCSVVRVSRLPTVYIVPCIHDLICICGQA